MAEIQNELTGTDRQPSSNQIRSEIERTRADMDETFDALERKMTPGQILGEAWTLTRGGTSAGASKLWQVAREHPLPSAVIGLGLGWLLVESSRGEERSSYGTSYNTNYNRARGGAGRSNWAGSGRSSLYESSAGYGAYPESYNANYQESYDASEGGSISGRVSSAADSVKDAASSAGHKVADVASSAGHKVADMAGSVREHASDLTHGARDKATALGYSTRYQARKAQTGFWQMMEENPLAVGIATLTLGVLAGLSLPATRKENELMGETRDKLVDRIEEAGREALEKGKQVAETAVETIKDEAESAGLTASGIAEKVREVGTKTKEEVQASTGAQGQGSTGSSAGLTTGGVTTPSATTGSTPSGSTGRSNTPRETITPVETPELSNKR
jgi:ElaB/YqjD/DUF883 family membrane-anchored ribosome-binding protein